MGRDNLKKIGVTQNDEFEFNQSLGNVNNV